MDRGGTKHSPRLDDEMKRETEAMTRGAPVETRAEESREKEGAGEDQPKPDAVIDLTTDAAGSAPAPDEIERRSELARFLRPSEFPATGERLVEVARTENAPVKVLEDLGRLPSAEAYENVQRVWEALGGRPERRMNVPQEPNRREPEPGVDDAMDLGEIALRVRDALDDAQEVDASHVDVAVSFGTVVLRGRIPTAEQATVALLVAEEAAGPASIANSLTVDRGLEESDYSPRATERAIPPDDEVLVGETDMLAGPDASMPPDLQIARDEPWDAPDRPRAVAAEPEPAEERGGVVIPPRRATTAGDLSRRDLEAAGRGIRAPGLDPEATPGSGTPAPDPRAVDELGRAPSDEDLEPMVEQVPGTPKGPGAVAEQTTEGGSLGSEPAVETGSVGADTEAADPARAASGTTSETTGVHRGPEAEEDRPVRDQPPASD